MIDLNFYPEQHKNELDGLLDVEVPSGWTVAQLIEALHDAKLMLWQELLHNDEDGNVWWE